MRSVVLFRLITVSIFDRLLMDNCYENEILRTEALAVFEPTNIAPPDSQAANYIKHKTHGADSENKKPLHRGVKNNCSRCRKTVT